MTREMWTPFRTERLLQPAMEKYSVYIEMIEVCTQRISQQLTEKYSVYLQRDGKGMQSESYYKLIFDEKYSVYIEMIGRQSETFFKSDKILTILRHEKGIFPWTFVKDDGKYEVNTENCQKYLVKIEMIGVCNKKRSVANDTNIHNIHILVKGVH